MSAAQTLLSLKDGEQIQFKSYGNYAHLDNAPRVDNLRVTILDERDGFAHTIGTPLAHVSPVSATHMWKRYCSLSQMRRPDVKFPQANNHLNYMVVSTGSIREWPVAPRASNFAGHVKDACSFSQKIEAAQMLGVVVVGGGAVGVEFAGKVKARYPRTDVTLIHSRGQLLSKEPLPDEFKARTLHLLLEEGVRQVRLTSGGHIHAGLVISAVTSVTPSTSFLPPAVLAADGSGDLALSNCVFAAGDIVDKPGIRLGGSAMIMGCVAAANIYSSILVLEPGALLVLEDCPEIRPHMALSIGTNIVCYAGDNGAIQYGKALAQSFFGGDLGWQRVLENLGLGSST
ncbi:hypothetical protein BO71DRAFT_416089 [Aspergillus ellipticus CBS 707.79]|uniref:FAD/NAD(P)-binding domain-containing protein n=1 Tax=Aspergillus ellipticus CBS 707.79 TaxID=1448320 RepID=A0A319DWR7_9EURO|nr:hypothetical protein BO71DRAFT_416089 [Aspergillus ellipticus CBS 707.79]